MSYQTEIEDIIGVLDPVVDAASYTQYLIDGCQELINLVPKDVLWTLGTFTSIYQGSVKSILITEGGAGDDNADPSLTTIPVFTAPQNDGGTTATGTCVVSGNEVTSITITESGDGYTSPPTITITSTDGSVTQTATATCTINTTPSQVISTNTILSCVRETDAYTSDVDNDGTLDATTILQCREIPAAQKGRVQPGSGWQEEVSDNDPVFYKENGIVYILPVPTKKNSGVYIAEPPSGLTAAATPPILPNELDYLVKLFAAIKVLNIHTYNETV